VSNLSLNNLSHHAYCLLGGDSLAEDLVLVLERDHGIVKSRNQDFFHLRYENFTIDDARTLKLNHEMRPVVDGSKKIFIIVADNINTEAQNALLKLLEEPASYAHFFIIIPGAHLLLPTVKSRLYFVESLSTDSGLVAQNSEAKKFLKLDKVKRLEYIKKLVEDITKEKKNKRDVIIFLHSLQDEIKAEKGVRSGVEALGAIDIALKYIDDRSPSVKMLLEYVALGV